MTPAATREEVRGGIVAALERDDLRAGERAARRLVVAAIGGIVAASALTMLFASDSGETESAWHLIVCSAVWAGLLVEAFAFMLLRIRTGRVAIVPAVALGLVGLGLAVAMRVVCPGLRVFHLWSSTSVGRATAQLMGEAVSALCLGICCAAVLGFVSFIALGERAGRERRALTSAVALSLLLLPAVTLQSAGFSWGFVAASAAGTALGAYLGITAAQWLAASWKH